MSVPTPADDAIASYQASFTEARGFLNFASFGPPSRAVRQRVQYLMELAGDGRTGINGTLYGEDRRARESFARLSGFPVENVGLTGSTSLGLFQVAELTLDWVELPTLEEHTVTVPVHELLLPARSVAGSLLVTLWSAPLAVSVSDSERHPVGRAGTWPWRWRRSRSWLSTA